MTFNFRLVNNEFQRFEFVIPSGSPGFGPRFWGCVSRVKPVHVGIEEKQ